MFPIFITPKLGPFAVDLGESKISLPSKLQKLLQSNPRVKGGYMSRKLARAMALSCAFILTAFTGLAIAGGNIFRGFDSTETGFSTWDADAINIENVSETGHGVYVAVLDTGLAPNYRDYFPSARI